MNLILNEVETRILGSLVEKQITLPDYYPLSLNAVMNACNQKSSRNPVVAYDEPTIQRGLDSLREKGVVWVFKGADSRVLKYGHVFEKAYELNERESAVLGVLMLRGAQTPGEIRARAMPLYPFDTLEEVETTIQGLIERDTRPLVVKLPRQAGTKESRYMHLLAGDVQVEYQEAPPREASPARGRVDEERVARLEEQLAAMRQELSELRQQFVDFKKQFE